MQMEVQRPSCKRRGKSSYGRMFMEDKVVGDEFLGLYESIDITTVNGQGVQWDFKKVEMRNQVFRKKVAETPLLLVGAHPSAGVA